MNRPTPETNKRIDEREPKDTDDLIQELYAADRHCRHLERQRDAAVEALKAADKHFADYLESIAPFASTEELKVELSQTRSGKLHAVIRAVLREIEGES